MSPAVTSLSSMLLNTVATETCMNSKQCRNFARNHDVELSLRGIKSLIDLINHHDFIGSNVKPTRASGIESGTRSRQDESVCMAPCVRSHLNDSGNTIVNSNGQYLDLSTCLNACSIMKSIPV